tara:strand:- start:446 stop:988 length:543 start_codon:yes stop_codon:yes gene_type:complete
MKNIILFLSMISISCYSIESGILRYQDGTYRTNFGSDGPEWNIVNNSNFILKENESMQILSTSNLGDGTYNRYIWYYQDRGGVTNDVQMITTGTTGIIPLESRTIYGPVNILGFRNEATPITYRIIRESDLNKEETKFSISLNNEGDRMAVGYKEDGSNAVIRVYQFDGADWDQLGTDID